METMNQEITRYPQVTAGGEGSRGGSASEMEVLDRDRYSIITTASAGTSVAILQRNLRFFEYAGAFLATVAGVSAFIGFGTTLAAAKKTDPKYFNKGIHGSIEMADAGAILALRALGWGTVYAVAGTSCICYGIWKLSGAKDLKDFRIKMGNMLPILPKNNPP